MTMTMTMTMKSLFAAITAAALLAACSKQEPKTAQPPVASTAAKTTPTAEALANGASGLTRVDDRSLVCMVNNQFMGRPQIPVEVDGKTYFGCCEMCKSRLANEAEARMAIDPFTQRQVDKSVAVIAKADTGAALYFENEATFLAYSKQMSAR